MTLNEESPFPDLKDFDAIGGFGEFADVYWEV